MNQKWQEQYNFKVEIIVISLQEVGLENGGHLELTQMRLEWDEKHEPDEAVVIQGLVLTETYLEHAPAAIFSRPELLTCGALRLARGRLVVRDNRVNINFTSTCDLRV